MVLKKVSFEAVPSVPLAIARMEPDGDPGDSREGPNRKGGIDQVVQRAAEGLPIKDDPEIRESGNEASYTGQGEREAVARQVQVLDDVARENRG